MLLIYLIVIGCPYQIDIIKSLDQNPQEGDELYFEFLSERSPNLTAMVFDSNGSYETPIIPSKNGANCAAVHFIAKCSGVHTVQLFENNLPSKELNLEISAVPCLGNDAR